MRGSNEQLTARFIEILLDSANRNSNALPMSQISTQPTWQRIFSEAVGAFLYELGYCEANGHHRVNGRQEDDQIRQLCENLNSRQRLKTYRQLYALDCRIDCIGRAIERLTVLPF